MKSPSFPFSCLRSSCKPRRFITESHISKTLVVESALRDIGGFLLFEDMPEEVRKVRKTRLGQFVDVDSGGRLKWEMVGSATKSAI